MIKSIIVEDDSKHSDRLRKLLLKTNNFIEVKEVCDNIGAAIDAIRKYKPELVFLDISLHGNSKGGFEILQKIEDVNFDVIFTTAHIDDNISEIRRCGLHYVVKPYISAEIEAALKKYDEKQKGSDEKQIKSLKSNLLAEKVGDKTIYIDFEGCLYPVLVQEIFYCFSKDPLMTFVIKTENPELNKSKVRRHDLTTKNEKHKDCIEWEKHVAMKNVEADFSDLNFCRIHNKYLVNMHHVKKFVPEINGRGKVILGNGEELAVSEAGKREFLKRVSRG